MIFWYLPFSPTCNSTSSKSMELMMTVLCQAAGLMRYRGSSSSSRYRQALLMTPIYSVACPMCMIHTTKLFAFFFYFFPFFFSWTFFFSLYLSIKSLYLDGKLIAHSLPANAHSRRLVSLVDDNDFERMIRPASLFSLSLSFFSFSRIYHCVRLLTYTRA